MPKMWIFNWQLNCVYLWSNNNSTARKPPSTAINANARPSERTWIRFYLRLVCVCVRLCEPGKFDNEQWPIFGVLNGIYVASKKRQTSEFFMLGERNWAANKTRPLEEHVFSGAHQSGIEIRHCQKEQCDAMRHNEVRTQSNRQREYRTKNHDEMEMTADAELRTLSFCQYCETMQRHWSRVLHWKLVVAAFSVRCAEWMKCENC